MFDKQIIYLESVGSTNRYLMEGEFEPGTVVSAKYQTDGKGRSGRKWKSIPGENLFFSVILPKFPNDKILGTQIVAGYAMVETLMPYADVRLKWPNDVVCANKKIGGLLIETQFAGSTLKKIVLGIGVNINSFPPEFSARAASLSVFMDTEPPCADIIMKSALERLSELFNAYIADELDITEEWPCYSAYYSKKLHFHKNGVLKLLIEKGITSDGRLIGLNENGEEEVISVEEIGYDFRI